MSADFYDHFSDSIDTYCNPFQRRTALHIYIEFTLRHILNNDFLRASGTNYVRKGRCESRFCSGRIAHLLAVDLLKAHDLELPDLADELREWVEEGCPMCPAVDSRSDGPDFDSWEEILDPEYDTLLEKLTEELFFVLFANRTFLFRFNMRMAGLIESSDAHDWNCDTALFKARKDGSTRLHRATIPEWAKRATFFRDRGRCCICERDLGAGFAPANNAQYDHMVALNQSGLNDVTNLQLLCKACNNQKRDNEIEPSQVYDRWYPVDYIEQPRTYPTLERVILGLAESSPGTTRPTDDGSP